MLFVMVPLFPLTTHLCNNSYGVAWVAALRIHDLFFVLFCFFFLPVCPIPFCCVMLEFIVFNESRK